MATKNKSRWIIYIVVLLLAGGYAVWNINENHISGHWVDTQGTGFAAVRTLLAPSGGGQLLAGCSNETDGLSISRYSDGAWTVADEVLGRGNTVIDLLDTGSDIWALVFAAGDDPGIIKSSADGGKSWNSGPETPELLETPETPELLETPELPDPRCIAACGKTRETILLGTVSTGIFRTSDHGKTWTSITEGIDNPHIQTLWVDPFNPDMVFAGTLTGMSRSMDQGLTWTTLTTRNPGLNGIVVDIQGSSINKGLILAVIRYTSGKCNLMRSSDGGETWSSSWKGLHPATQIRCIEFNSQKPGELYIGTVYDGVFISRNDGIFYESMNTDLPLESPIIVHALNYVQTDPPHLYAGTDKKGTVFRYDFN